MEEIRWQETVTKILIFYLSKMCIRDRAYSHEEALKMIQKGKCGVFNPLLIELSLIHI